MKLSYLNNLKLSTRIVLVAILTLAVVVTVSYVVFVRGYWERAQDAMVEKAKAFSAVADEAKNHASRLHQAESFKANALADEAKKDLAAGKSLESTRLFGTIPVVAGWTAAQEAAKRENIKFRITTFEARNKKNEPAPGSFEEKLLRQLTEQVAGGKSEIVHAVDKATDSLHFMRAIRLTESCMGCHGEPNKQGEASSGGLDLTGHRMEGWKPGYMHGSYHVVMPLAPVRQQVASFIFSALVWTVPIVLVMIGAFIYIIWQTIRRPVQSLTERTAAIAQGDLTQDVPQELQERRDEIGDLARALSELGLHLRSSLLEVVNSTGTLSVMSNGLMGTSQRLSNSANATAERANVVAAAAEEASANTASVATSMDQATSNLTSVASATEELSATVADIASNSAKARSVSESAGVQAKSVVDLMGELGKAAQEIGKVTETITKISAQTNLLALNATIEAARAGAAGKGFAVVAHEIKELAHQTAGATEDIKAKIDGVQSCTGSAIADIEKITGVMKEIEDLVSSIAAAIEEQTAVTKDVAGSIGQASAGVRTANENVSQTATVSTSIAKDIAAISVQGRAINSDSIHLQEDADMLSDVTRRLENLSSKFKLGKQVDFREIKQAHLHWRSRIIDMFEDREQLATNEVSDHHACGLGKWCDGPGHDQYGRLPRFHELAEQHERFHELVRHIVERWNSGDKAGARGQFENLVPMTKQLFGLLDDLCLQSGAEEIAGSSTSATPIVRGSGTAPIQKPAVKTRTLRPSTVPARHSESRLVTSAEDGKGWRR